MKSKEQEQTRGISVRLPVRLYEQLKKLADAEHRSLNGQVTMLLESQVTEKAHR